MDLPLYSSLLVGGIRKQLVELSFVIGNGRFDRYIGIRQELRRWFNAFNLLQNLLNRRMDLRLLISHRNLNPDRVYEDTDISRLPSDQFRCSGTGRSVGTHRHRRHQIADYCVRDTVVDERVPVFFLDRVEIAMVFDFAFLKIMRQKTQQY